MTKSLLNLVWNRSRILLLDGATRGIPSVDETVLLRNRHPLTHSCINSTVSKVTWEDPDPYHLESVQTGRTYNRCHGQVSLPGSRKEDVNHSILQLLDSVSSESFLWSRTLGVTIRDPTNKTGVGKVLIRLGSLGTSVGHRFCQRSSDL